MQAWHFSETAYHLLPPAETYDSIRVSLPNRHYDPRIGADLYHRLPRRMAARRGRRPRHHAQRASPDRDLRRSRGAADAGRAGAAKSQGAAADSGQSDRQSPPADPRRRGNGDDRRAVARPAGGRVRARRALRNLAREQQPDAHERTRVRSAGHDHQGLDQPRRAGQLRGPLLPRPPDQHLAAAVSNPASADLDQHDKPRRRGAGRRTRVTCRQRS